LLKSQVYEKLAQGFYAVCPAENRTASPTLYTDAATMPL